MLAPDQPAGPFNLGLALQALGEHEEARRALLRAAALAPDDAEIADALAALPARVTGAGLGIAGPPASRATSARSACRRCWS